MELNEYLSESRKKRLRRRRKFLFVVMIVAVLVIIGAILWFFLWSPVFRVTTIVVRGNANVTSDTIIALAESSFTTNRHLFSFLGARNMLAWSGAIAPDILAHEPALASVSFSKDYGSHAIVLTVTERQPFAIWCFIAPGVGDLSVRDVSGGAMDVSATTTIMVAPVSANESCYWFDNTGILFAPSFDTEGDLLLAVHDYSQTDPGLGGSALSDRFMPNMISVLNLVRASGLRVEEVRLNDVGLEEIQVTTYNGPSIYFSLRFPVDSDTLAALQSVMSKSNFDSLQYVDFRTQGRMYYE